MYEGQLGNNGQIGTTFFQDIVMPSQYRQEKIVKISSGPSYAFALLSSGLLLQWGSFRRTLLGPKHRSPVLLFPEIKFRDAFAGSEVGVGRTFENQIVVWGSIYKYVFPFLLIVIALVLLF